MESQLLHESSAQVGVVVDDKDSPRLSHKRHCTGCIGAPLASE